MRLPIMAGHPCSVGCIVSCDSPQTEYLRLLRRIWICSQDIDVHIGCQRFWVRIDCNRQLTIVWCHAWSILVPMQAWDWHMSAGLLMFGWPTTFQSPKAAKLLICRLPVSCCGMSIAYLMILLMLLNISELRVWAWSLSVFAHITNNRLVRSRCVVVLQDTLINLSYVYGQVRCSVSILLHHCFKWAF